MKALPLPARIYLLALVVVAAALLAALLVTDGRPEAASVPLAAVLAAGMTLAFLYPLAFAPKTKLHLDTSVLVAAVLLFEPGIAMLIAGTGPLLAGTIRRQSPRQTAFNTAQIMLQAAAGGLILASAGWDASPLRLDQPGHWLALLLAAMAMYVVNTLAVATIVGLQSGRPPVSVWYRSVIRLDTVETVAHLAQLGFGLLVAIVADAAGWALLLLLPPAAACYSALARHSRLRREAEAQAEALARERAALQETMAQNDQLYEILAARERQLHGLVGRLFTAQEEERRRVAYDVHDGLAQLATAAHRHLDAFADRHVACQGPGQGDLERALDLLSQTVDEARRVIGNLRPTALDDFGLTAAIRTQVDALRAEGWQVSYEAASGGERLPAALETALFRIAQEALSNVRKHAGTSRVRIALTRTDGLIRLEVADSGRGFASAAVDGEVNPPGEHVGLAGMRERAALLGGTLTVDSRPGAGTAIVVTLPLPASLAARRPAALVGAGNGGG